MKPSIVPLLVAVVSLAIPAGAAERNMMQPLVLADIRACTSPLPNSPKMVEQGKALHYGATLHVNVPGPGPDGHACLVGPVNHSKQ